MTAPLLQIESPPPPPRFSRAPAAPWLRLAFRPFYMGAAGAAVLLMLLWFGIYTGRVPLPNGIAPTLWHAHEMLFGFVAAVIVGFLFTAGKTWTGLATPQGTPLAALFGLWVAARLAAFGPSYALFCALDAAFLPVVAFVLSRVLIRAKNWRNLVVAAIVAALALANIAFHLASTGAIPLAARAPLLAALALVTLLESVIGGRIIPSFTANVTPGLRIRRVPGLDRSALLTTFLGLALWVGGAPSVAAGPALLAAALLQAARALSWAPWKAAPRPILFVLHASYAWIPAALALLAAAAWGVLSESAGIHALAVGATGGLILAMITRTARGHTGRQIVATKAEVCAYLAVGAAALVRVLAAVDAGAWHDTTLVLAGALWIAAFAIYLWVFVPWLTQARIDGRDG